MTQAMVLAQTLLACLNEALQARANPPAQVCLRAGEQVTPLLGTVEDECCSGLGWVRVAQVDPRFTVDDFNSDCVSSMRRVTLEMGVARCMPWGTTQAPPTCDQWTAVALQLDSDHDAMEAALCCAVGDFLALVDDPRAVPGLYAPFGPDGNCIGGTMQVIVEYDCGCQGA